MYPLSAIAVLLLFLLVSCEMNVQSRQQTQLVEQLIIAKETAALDYWSAGDPVSFGKGFAEDATYFDDVAAPTRLDGKEAILEYFSTLAGQVPEHDFELVDPKVQVYGDVAILTLHYHGTINDTVLGEPWKATAVYRLQEGDWKVVHAHWSVKE